LSAPLDTSKDVLRGNILPRLEEAASLKDWTSLEFWAKQWIETDPMNKEGFRWLGRATLAQKQLQRAAYAYSRILDFDKDDSEANRFFAQYPSSALGHESSATQSHNTKAELQTTEGVLSPEDRAQLASAELKCAELYQRLLLHADASRAYKKSFEWESSQPAALGLARSLHHLNRGHEATQFLREQLFYFSDWVEGRLLLGRILFELGQKSEAQQEWQSVLHLDPKNETALNFLRGLFLSAR